MMRAIVKTKAGIGAEFLDVEKPKCGPRSLLVKVKYASICGSDVDLYHWGHWAQSVTSLPRIMGHEFIGEVVEIGGEVTNFKKGDHVSAETHIVCDRCVQCRTGREHICRNTKIIGFHTDGAFADYIAIPASNAWYTPTNIPLEYWSVQEPLGNAVHATLAGEISGMSTAVIGCGPVGLLSIAVARASGAAPIIAADLSDYRLDIAKKLGADITLNAKEVNIIDEVRRVTNNEGADVVLEMSGSTKGVQDAFKLVAKGGRISLLGLPGKPIEINTTDDIVMKGIKVHGIIGREMYNTWRVSSALLAQGRIDVSKIITHKIKLEDFKKGFELMHSGKSGKVVMSI